MPFKFLSVFFALMMNLFPHPDCALILEHVLFHPHAAWCKLLRCSWAPVMETATQAATSNACQDKSPDRRASWLSVFLYLIQNYCNNLSLSLTPDPPQPSPQSSCRSQSLDQTSKSTTETTSHFCWHHHDGMGGENNHFPPSERWPPHETEMV